MIGRKRTNRRVRVSKGDMEIEFNIDDVLDVLMPPKRKEKNKARGRRLPDGTYVVDLRDVEPEHGRYGSDLEREADDLTNMSMRKKRRRDDDEEEEE